MPSTRRGLRHSFCSALALQFSTLGRFAAMRTLTIGALKILKIWLVWALPMQLTPDDQGVKRTRELISANPPPSILQVAVTVCV